MKLSHLTVKQWQWTWWRFFYCGLWW